MDAGNRDPDADRDPDRTDPLAADPSVAAAVAGDEAAFAQLVQRHQRELQVHCYRMTGSYAESEDLVQETFLRAWRRIDTYAGRSTFRAWLYRIATNACLDALRGRQRRLMPYDVAPPADPDGPPVDGPPHPGVDPFPDHLLAGGDDAEPGAAVVAQETIELAFLAAIQHLPPRQRAAVIMRDVLGWSARETAEQLDVSEPAVKSLLQRARPVLRRHLPAGRDEWQPDEDPDLAERVLLQRYMDAHEQDDVEALAAVLREDVRVSYPPYPMWCDNRDDFIVGSRKFAPPGEVRFVATRANRQPACAIYLRPPGADGFHPVALEVLRVEGGRIAEIVDYGDPALFEAFELPATL
ncbi:MAG: RNA polymerase subunit sigma-70 [Acidimicrobiales bacterium]|nr:RNA polymerase subunit sigma-70 [Acidimicrobiales bacterium]